MSMTFQPGILVGTQFYAVPQPIIRMRIQDHWDFDRFKVLFQDGDTTTGLSRKGCDIAVTGQIAQQAENLLFGEAEMLSEIETFRNVLLQQNVSRFDFYLYRNEQTETCRYFRHCSAARFQYDLSRPELFSYELTIHADDPQIYSSWPVL